MPTTRQTLILPRTLTVKIARHSRGQLWRQPIGRQLVELTEIALLAGWFVTVIVFLLLIWSVRFLLWSLNAGFLTVLRIIFFSLRLWQGLRIKQGLQAICKF